MECKKTVDKYLSDNFADILYKTKTFGFRWQMIADQIECCPNPEYLRDRWRKLKKKMFPLGEIGYPVFNTAATDKFRVQSGKENKDRGQKEFTFTADNIPTEQEIIEHFNIDVTKWKIVNIYHKTSFKGKYSITVQANLLKGIESRNYEDQFKKFLDTYNVKIIQNPKKDKLKATDDSQGESLYLICLSDLHIGNYQKSGYLNSIEEKVTYCLSHIRRLNCSEVIILNTGDMLHTDTSKAQTWNNTQLDAQDSFEDAFTNGLNFTTSIIDYSRELSLNTTFVNVRGNHSFDTEYCLGEALKKVYKLDEKVTILNSKDTRIYYKWRNNGFLFTHGDKGVDRLPLIFATEGREVFNSTDHHHILLGHLHHNKGKQFIDDRGEFAGIEVRVLGSPTSNDIWHKQNAFCQNKKAIQCMQFTEEQGKFAEYNFKM